MKKTSFGFTLVETVIATGILVTASAAIATLFVSSIRTNLNNRDRTAADLLLSDKIEELSVVPLSNPQWQAGDYVDYASTGADGTPIVSPADPTLKYVRTWQIAGTQLRTLTVVVSSNHSAITGRPAELIRATVVAGPGW